MLLSYNLTSQSSSYELRYYGKEHYVAIKKTWKKED